MNELAYFELFGRISDRFVSEAFIPAALPVPVPGKGFKQTPFGKFLTSPAFVVTVGALAAAAVAVAIGLGIAGQGRNPNAETQATSDETRWESVLGNQDGSLTEDPTEDRDDTHGESNPYEETDVPIDQDHPYIARKSYGADIGIFYGKDRMGEGFGYLPADMVFAGATALNADLYERIQKTEEYLGVSIGLVELEDDNAVLDTVGKMSGSWVDDNYFFIASGEVIARMGGSGSDCMTAWDTLEAIRTEADYWDGDLFKTHTQGGHCYMAYNSFIPPNAYAIAYSKSLYAAAPVQRDLYALVESGDWTLDTLMAVLNETASINGSLSIHNLTGINVYLSSVGFRVLDTVETDVGYTQSFNFTERKETLEPLYLKALELISCDRVNLVTVDGNDPPFIEQGEVLMDTRLTRDLAREAYGRSFGVLPLPKYDKAQSEYVSLHVNTYMGLWCNQDNKQMCGEVAELLAYFSQNAEADYNRAVMGVYGKDDSGVRKDLAMLRIIHGTTHDVGLANSYLAEHFAKPLMNGESDISFVDSSRIKNAVRLLSKLYGW